MDRGRRALPHSNPIVYKKYMQRKHDVHVQRLKEVKPTVDTSAPKS